MTRLTFPAMLALTAFASMAMAQSATETEPSTTPRQTEPSASDPSQTPGQTTPGARPGQATTQRQPGQAGQAGQPGGLDQQIAACMVLANQQEIALAQFAKDRSESDQVKQFAKMLIEQHQQAITKIEQASPQVAAWKIQLRNAKSDQQAGAEAQPQANGQATGQNPQFLMARQIHEECLALTKEALSEKEGADFDKAFVTQQCLAHIGMKAGIKGSEPFASQQLKPVLQEGLKMTEKHLAEAKNLMKQLKDDAAGEPRQARAPQ